AAGAVYTASLSTGVTDATGDAMEAVYSWTFTTATAQPDFTAPTVRSIYPADNSTGFSVSGVITARFSEPMDQSSIDELTFGLFVGAVRVEGYVDYDPENYIATFYPDNDLEYNTAYTVTLTDDIRDAAGNRLAGNYSWDFATAAEPSGDAPRVQWVFPADASTDFPIWKNLAVRFSKPMNADSIHEGTFVLFRGSTRISGSVAYNAATHTATFDPDRNLSTGTEYTVDLSTSITDEESNRITGDDSWSFSTEVGDPFGRTKKSDGGDGCSSIAEASTPSGGAGPVAPGLMSLAVTMLFPLSLMMLHRRIRRMNRE
ncbi:MAG TPA: Ig-like domain-containing protein, partial [Spirochaetota bacterium]|nr:Ig-like domain-containing protein [Spirochaetota bacterium]